MRPKPSSPKKPAAQVVKDIRRATRRLYGAEEKIRIVLEGLRGDDSIAEVCRKEGIAQSLYYAWSKDFMEAGKRRLAGDTARAATTDEVKELRREASALKAFSLASYDAAIGLLTLLDQSSPFEVDVVWPTDGSDGKLDPDSWLRGREKGDADQALYNAKVPVLVFLGAFRLGADPHAVDWNKHGRLKLAAEARHIALPPRSVLAISIMSVKAST